MLSPAAADDAGADPLLAELRRKQRTKSVARSNEGNVPVAMSSPRARMHQHLNPEATLGGVPIASMRMRMENALAARRAVIAGGQGDEHGRSIDVEDDEWE